MEAMSPNRVSSWAANEKERDARIRHAQRLVGLSVAAVRYFDLDYTVARQGIESTGPRLVTDATEWEAPTWRFEACHSVDYGVEIETTTGRVFSFTWDPPGRIEGLGLREEPLVGETLRPDAPIAIWNVGERSEWRDRLGMVVSSLTMHYRPWDDSGASWCPRVTITIGDTPIEFLLAECHANPPGLRPSADNVVVLFDASSLPEWI